MWLIGCTWRAGRPQHPPAPGLSHTLPRLSAQARRAGVCQQPSLQPRRLVRGSQPRSRPLSTAGCPPRPALVSFRGPAPVSPYYPFCPAMDSGAVLVPFQRCPSKPRHSSWCFYGFLWGSLARLSRKTLTTLYIPYHRLSFPTCWSPPPAFSVIKLTIFCGYCCFK